GTVSEIAEKLKLNPEKVRDQDISGMTKGSIFYNKRNDHIHFATSIVNLTDFAIANPYYDKETERRILDLVKAIRTCKEYLEGFGQDLIEEGKDQVVFRIIPKWNAVKDIPGVMPCESLKDILEENRDRISTTRCLCRTTLRLGDCNSIEGTRPEEGHCGKLGEVAEFCVDGMGIGSYLTPEEMMVSLAKLDKLPYYHMIGNAREVKGGFCNCCSCCCDMRMGAKAAGDVKLGMLPSRFLAVIDEEKCINDQICIMSCPFFAMKYDQETEKVKIDDNKCMGCGTCVLACGQDAIHIEIVRPASYIPVTGPQHIYESIHMGEEK
ncbi:MAG: 4Fe-4S dicluster domain-containing protein, partial [Candidatus Atribacteria bacterium]